MLGFLKYKSRYESLLKSYKLLERKLIKETEDFDNFKQEMEKKFNNQRYDDTTENLKLKMELSNKDDTIKVLEKTIADLKEQLASIEKKRRVNAGKVGSYVKKMQFLANEKKEMMDLINNLIDERQKILKLKKRPTLNELKKYFRKG